MCEATREIMAYTAEKRQVRTIKSRIHAPSPDDEIVISGISGKFPNSKNLAEFSHNLYNKVNVDDDSVNCFFFFVLMMINISFVYSSQRTDRYG